MRHASANSTVGELRTPESLLINRERAEFRQRVIDEAVAAVTVEHLRLIIYARYQLAWTFEQIADAFEINQMAVWRAHEKALEIMRQQLAARGVKQLTDIL